MWVRSFIHKMPIGTKSANLRAGGKEYGRRMLMEQERRVTRRNGSSVLLPPPSSVGSSRLLRPFRNFSRSTETMDGAGDWVLFGELLGGREDSASGVRRARIPSGKSQRKFLKKSMTSFVLVIPNR